MPGTTRKGSWLYRVVPYQPHAVPRACLPGSTEPNHDHRVRRVRRVRPARPGAAVSLGRCKGPDKFTLDQTTRNQLQ